MRPAPICARCLTTIMKYIPAPEGDMEGPAQVLISTIDYNDYVGRIGVGRIEPRHAAARARWWCAATIWSRIRPRRRGV